MSLATLDDVQRFRKVTESDLEGIEAFLAMADAWAVGEIGCDLTYVEGTVERLSGDGTQILFPNCWPIIEVTTLQIEDLDLTLTVMTDASAEAYQDVYIPAHRFYMILRETWQSTYNLSVWPKGQANIKLTYKHGYATMPADVPAAVAQLTHLLWKERTTLGMASGKSGALEVNSVVRQLKEYPFIASTLAKYRRPRVY